jgi:hypothetical protein
MQKCSLHGLITSVRLLANRDRPFHPATNIWLECRAIAALKTGVLQYDFGSTQGLSRTPVFGEGQD